MKSEKWDLDIRYFIDYYEDNEVNMDCENGDDGSRNWNNRNSHGSRDPCWFVKKHLDEVDWESLSYNTSIPLEFFKEHALAGTHGSASKLSWLGLSQNTSIPLEFFKEHLNTHGSASKLDWYWVSQNTSIPLDFFEEHLDKVNWSGLSRNTSIVDKPLNIKGAKR